MIYTWKYKNLLRNIRISTALPGVAWKANGNQISPKIIKPQISLKQKEKKGKVMNAAVSFIGGANGNRKGLSATLAANPGDLKLRASFSDTNFTDDCSTLNLDELLISVEKPGSFLIDFDIAKKDVQFQFMNTFKVEGKMVNWTYTHMMNVRRTILEGSMMFDRTSKLSLSHELGTVSCKFKCSYVHKGLTTFEPCYDLAKKSWDLAVSRKVPGGDLIKANYETSSQILGVEWSSSSLFYKDGRNVKVSASFNLAEGLHTPQVSVQSMWNFQA